MCFWMISLKDVRVVKSELWMHFLKFSFSLGNQVHAWGHRNMK